MYPLHRMTTNKGETVEVIDPGLHNRNAGPDFFNAKIKVDGMLWLAMWRFTTRRLTGFCMATTRTRHTTT